MGAAIPPEMEFLGQVIADAFTWAPKQAEALLKAVDNPPPGTFAGDGGDPAAAGDFYSHYGEDLEHEGPPPVPEERPDLSQEELDAKLSEVSDVLARPDPSDVSKAVTTLVAMSDAQRQAAMSQLSDDEFTALMDNLPLNEQERLGELVAATDDPKRKLEVWKASEKAELERDTRNLDQIPRSMEIEGDEEKLLHRRMDANREGLSELDDETTVAEAKLEGLSEEEQKKYVDELIARKGVERDLEQRHGVNITNDRTEGQRAVWTLEEIRDLKEVLDELPPSAAADDTYLTEIRREIRDDAGNVGSYNGGVLRIFDNAMSDQQDHHGDTSALSGFDEDNPLKAVQQTIAHELGHNAQGSAGEKAFTDSVWREESGDDARAKLEATNASGVAPDGRVYLEVGGEIISYDQGQLPEGGAHSGGADSDTWNYARSRQREYFAESYSKATLVPELYYQDLITGPADRVAKLRAANASPEEIAEAEKDQAAMAKQHATMRTSVLGFNEADVESGETAMAERADEMGLDEAAREKFLADYRARAAMAMTPQQLERLNEQHWDAAYDY
jgi:hypothetical protein